MKTEVRVDKWLWAMRVFKTRTVSTDSCKKGRVMLRIGGEGPEVVAKPSRMIHVGDVVMVRKPPITYSFKVKALTENRLGAKLVPEYMENVTTRDQTPPLGWSMKRNRASSAAACAHSAALPSLEPSLMRIASKSVRVCARNERSARGSRRSIL